MIANIYIILNFILYKLLNFIQRNIVKKVKMQPAKIKYCVIANWKCNGTTDFVRDIVTNLVNDL